MQFEEKVISTISGGIGVIEFFHPKSNSLPSKMLTELSSAFNTFARDANVKVIIFQSKGEKTFCAGASFDELLAVTNPEEGKTFFTGFANLINAMRKCPKFIIVRVHGKAIGGGVGLIAAADYSLALNNADVRLSELGIGLGPFVVGPAIERKTGKSAFTQMAIDHQWHSAEWAYQKGLYNKIFSTVKELDEEVKKLAENLALCNPAAMTKLKNTFWVRTENWDNLLEQKAAESGELVLSDFTRNAINSFKRK